MCDYKTGKRKDFYSGVMKDEENLKEDIQLLIYNWAAHELYPDIKQFSVTIYYINDGGPYPILFDENAIDKVKDNVRKKFEYLRTVKYPKLNKSWKCTKYCDFGKSTFEDTAIEPIIEFRDGQFATKGECMKKCSQVQYMMEQRGPEWVLENMKNI